MKCLASTRGFRASEFSIEVRTHVFFSSLRAAGEDCDEILPAKESGDKFKRLTFLKTPNLKPCINPTRFEVPTRLVDCGLLSRLVLSLPPSPSLLFRASCLSFYVTTDFGIPNPKPPHRQAQIPEAIKT